MGRGNVHGAFEVARPAPSIAAALTLVACSGAQSALAPAGPAAQKLADLFWWMAGGAILIWLVFVGLAVHALYGARERERYSARAGRILIIGGGVVLPTVLLT